MNKRQRIYAEGLAAGLTRLEAEKKAGYKRWRSPKADHPKIRAYLQALMGDGGAEVAKPPPVRIEPKIAPEPEVVEVISPVEVLELAAGIARDETAANRDRLTAIRLLGMFHNLWSDQSGGGQTEPAVFQINIGIQQSETVVVNQ